MQQYPQNKKKLWITYKFVLFRVHNSHLCNIFLLWLAFTFNGQNLRCALLIDKLFVICTQFFSGVRTLSIEKQLSTVLSKKLVKNSPFYTVIHRTNVPVNKPVYKLSAIPGGILHSTRTPAFTHKRVNTTPKSS